MRAAARKPRPARPPRPTAAVARTRTPGHPAHPGARTPRRHRRPTRNRQDGCAAGEHPRRHPRTAQQAQPECEPGVRRDRPEQHQRQHAVARRILVGVVVAPWPGHVDADRHGGDGAQEQEQVERGFEARRGHWAGEPVLSRTPFVPQACRTADRHAGGCRGGGGPASIHAATTPPGAGCEPSPARRPACPSCSPPPPPPRPPPPQA